MVQPEISCPPASPEGAPCATAIVDGGWADDRRSPAGDTPWWRRTRRPWHAARWVWAAVALLLGSYATMALTAAKTKGVSFDEGLQLAVGYNLWLNHDFRTEGANGDLVKRWATLPYLVSQPKFVPQSDPAWKRGLGYDLGRLFFFDLGNRPESLLLQARAMIVLLGVATGLLVFLCARELFGNAGGLVSLTLFVFSPAMLAFGAVVSTDMSITLTLFGTTWCVWRLLHEITPWRLLAGLVSTGCMVLAKPTALVIFPIAAVLVAVRLAVRQPLSIRWRDRQWTIGRRRCQALVFAALVLVHIAAGWAAIWAHYEFRYTASAHPSDPTLVLFQPPTRDAVPAVWQATLDWMRRTHALPEGFHAGIQTLLLCDDALGAFMNGKWKLGGWPTFFPYAIWVKTPPALFLLLALGALVWWRLRRRGVGGTARPWGDVVAPALYAASPHLALIGCYLALAMTENLNIGHRHVLPLYPSLHVLAGAVALGWSRARVWLKVAIVGALGWLAVESFVIRPHYLAYFGPQAGGPSQGYKRLVDSSLEWGMNLPSLKRWLDVHNPGGRETVYLAYFGNDAPQHYGINAKLLPGFFDWRPFELSPLAPGYYAISASIFQGVYTAAFGPWSREYEDAYQALRQKHRKFLAATPAERAAITRERSLPALLDDFDLFENLRLARLCAWLRHRGEPPADIGYSLFIWKLDRAALNAALEGPPAELVDRPPRLRRYREFVPPAR